MQASKSAVADLNRFIECLATFDDLSVAQFCKTCEQLKPTAPTSTKPAAIADALVDSYVTLLKDATGDRDKFNAVMTKLKADKSVRIAELSEIAQQFVGGTSKYTRKPDAYKEITLRFEAHLRAVKRLDAASDIF